MEENTLSESGPSETHLKRPKGRAISIEIKGMTLRVIYGLICLITVSGIAWLILHYFLSSQGTFGRESNPLEPWALRFHGAAAFGMLILLGFLIPVHMRLGWYTKRHRRSGGTLVAINGFLIVTGYALYYCGVENARFWISALHSAVGIVLPISVILHVLSARKENASRLDQLKHKRDTARVRRNTAKSLQAYNAMRK